MIVYFVEILIQIRKQLVSNHYEYFNTYKRKLTSTGSTVEYMGAEVRHNSLKPFFEELMEAVLSRVSKPS